MDIDTLNKIHNLRENIKDEEGWLHELNHRLKMLLDKCDHVYPSGRSAFKKGYAFCEICKLPKLAAEGLKLGDINIEFGKKEDE